MYFIVSSFYIKNEEVALQKVDETLKEIMDLLIVSRINNGKDSYVNPNILKKTSSFICL